MPANAPMMIAPMMLTEEQDGVIATRPATTPDAAPSEVGRPSRMRSTNSQPNIAVAVAANVVKNVTPAMPFDATAEPALNPNQPNHSSPAPNITNGRLCGLIGVFGQ